MINIEVKDSVLGSDFMDNDAAAEMTANIILSDDVTCPTALHAFIEVLKLVGYMDSSILTALDDELDSLKENIEINHKTKLEIFGSEE